MEMEWGEKIVKSVQELVEYSKTQPTEGDRINVLTGKRLVVTIHIHHLHISFLTEPNILFTKKIPTANLETDFSEELGEVLSNTYSRVNLVTTDLFDVRAMSQMFTKLAIKKVDVMRVFGQFEITHLNYLLQFVTVKKLQLEVDQIDFSWDLIINTKNHLKLVNLQDLSNTDLSACMNYATVEFEDTNSKPGSINHVLRLWRKGSFPNLQKITVTDSQVPMKKSEVLCELVVCPSADLDIETWRFNRENLQVGWIYLSRNGKNFVFEASDTIEDIFQT